VTLFKDYVVAWEALGRATRNRIQGNRGALQGQNREPAESGANLRYSLFLQSGRSELLRHFSASAFVCILMPVAWVLYLNMT
jgi:hypothetical protein